MGMRIKFWTDTAANWASENPVLLEGEIGFVSDTRLAKFGDGVTAWNSLSYLTVGNSQPGPFRFGDYDGGNYAEFEEDGTLVFHGDARTWRDEKILVNMVKVPTSNAPAWGAYKGGQVLEFSGSADQIIYFNAQINHDLAEGENIEFHFHYVPEDNTAGNHRWIFTHSWASIEGIFPAETTVTKVLATPEVTDQHTIGQITSSISGTGKGISSILICSLQRTGSHADDTYNSKHIKFLSADFHYLCNMFGSREMTSK